MNMGDVVFEESTSTDACNVKYNVRSKRVVTEYELTASTLYGERIGLMLAGSQLTKRMDFLIARYSLRINFVMFNLFVLISSGIVFADFFFSKYNV